MHPILHLLLQADTVLCRVYKTFRSVSGSATLLDTIQVPDSFAVGSIQVSHVLVHPSPPAAGGGASLTLALLHRASLDSPVSLVSVLQQTADNVQGAAYTPADAAVALAGVSARGEWVLNITDNQPGADQ